MQNQVIYLSKIHTLVKELINADMTILLY